MVRLADTLTAPFHVGHDTVDPRYDKPYVELDEQRSEPVPHRYVHGGFTGTDARFSFYFPPDQQYRGRFFHNTYPMALTSDIGPFPIQFDVAMGDLGFTIDSGAYYVQTNLGGMERMRIADPTIGAYRVNAAAAKFSREVAARIYGDHRPYGYLFGGSGGSYQVMGASENTSGIWDGFLPYVLGTPYALPSMFTIRVHALRVLRQRNRLAAVMDAINPGGTGDPYATLDEEEAAALREACLMGYPPKGWWNHDRLDSGYLGYNIPSLMAADPGYNADFWSKPGYLGADPASSIHAARVQFETIIEDIVEGPRKLLRFAEVPDKDFADAQLIILSGEGQGGILPLGPKADNPMAVAFAVNPQVLASIKPGDRVRIDNSFALAVQTYHRHQVPDRDDLPAWDQFRDDAGAPVYPQRPSLYGPHAATTVAGSVPSGKAEGKMLILETMMDIDALPWQADHYYRQVRRNIRSGAPDDVAIWFIDHAQHDDPQDARANAHSVSFAGALQQGLRDLARWVETGEKPSETSYNVTDCQIEVPADPVQRGGVQPIVELMVNGGDRADVMVGEQVSFIATAAVPPGAGKLVSVEWDFEGKGSYRASGDISPVEQMRVTTTYAFARPGTYFPVVRVAAHRDGDPMTPYARVMNIARARIIVF
jgi:hypothetical protein